jgi:hypothetical protein
MKFEKAKNLEEAWHNFDPDLILPMPEGRAFYVERKKHSLAKLRLNLLRAKQPKKYFVCGHKGSGKSTELNCLAVDKDLANKFKIVHFSLYETCDFATLTYIDLPVSIALQLKENADISLSNKWKDELDQWFMTITKEIDKNEGYDTGIEGGVNTFFAGFKLKLKTGTTWRSHMKKVIEPRLSPLLELLNHAVIEIKEKEKKDLLVIIDNIEKANDAKIKEIIRDNYTSLMQTDIFIIYTLPISLRGDREVVIPRDQLYPIPCIKYFNKGQRDKFTEEGKQLLIEFIDKRMSLDLIEEKAMEEAIRLSSGVFKELARVMQIAIDSALEADRNKILLKDLEYARHEIVKSYQPILRPKDYELMHRIAQSNDWLDDVEFMLQHLIVLEYENDSLWLDVRYALIQFLEEKLRESKT